MNAGDRVEIVRDYYGQRNRRISLIGRTGTIRRRERSPESLQWDVHLDEPLPDGRVDLHFSRHELLKEGKRDACRHNEVLPTLR